MNIRQELEDLITFLKRQAERSRSSTATADYVRGLDAGYAGAYTRCIEWLTDILKIKDNYNEENIL